MLTEIRLLNFKSFTDVTIPILPMTLLAGLNNTGKSSIIQALRMLWKWASVDDPTLPGHGSLAEMKNINSPRLDPIKITCSFKKKHQIEISVSLVDPEHPVIK